MAVIRGLTVRWEAISYTPNEAIAPQRFAVAVRVRLTDQSVFGARHDRRPLHAPRGHKS